MLKRTRLLSFMAALGLVFVVCQSAIMSAKDKLDPQKLVAEHLKSIGNPEALAKIKNRGMSGRAMINFIQGGEGKMVGQSLFASEGKNFMLVLHFGGAGYPGEYFAYNGEEVTVGNMSPGQRSPFGDFIYRHGDVMKDGLLGGVMSLNWPLLDLESRKPSLKFGEAKVEGRNLYRLEYSPKQGLKDVKVKLYFDPQTFRHVRTEYIVRVRGEQGLQAGNQVTRGTGNLQSGTQPVTRDAGIQDSISDSVYTLVESFEDFKEVEGITLPRTYVIDYSVEGQGSSFLAKWTAQVDNWIHNGKIDPSSFKVH
jgi:hypothetical protein